MKKTAIITVLAAFAIVGQASAQKLVIKGSDTLGAKFVPQLAEAYKAGHPETKFEIAAEGSSTGIAAVIDGTADIGMSSRRAKTIEASKAAAKGVEMKPTIVAYDGIAVIANAKNSINGLTGKQVEQIFTGDITNWSSVGGAPGEISIYTRNTASGTYADFQGLAMNKRDYAGSSQKMAGNEQIASEVSKNPNGIGYVGLAYVHTPGVKVLKVDGSLPDKASIQSKKYPLSRPTFYYTNGAPKGAAADFVTFTLSGEGQKIAEQVGFVPIK